MTYNGIEIDMLSLGNADCILLSHWQNGTPTRVLVDGGNKGDAAVIKSFLKEKANTTSIDHVVCTHPDRDHSGGLIELLKDTEFEFKRAWIHNPHKHADIDSIRRYIQESKVGEHAVFVQESLNDVESMFAVLAEREIPHDLEPFTGAKIGFLEVVGPTENYYKELLGRFRDVDDSEKVIREGRASTDSALEELESTPPASPENNSSVIMKIETEGNRFVLTGDAGTEALEKARADYDLSSCTWLQIPHHGSWRNVNRRLIEYFRPATCFVSAKGNEKHPRDIVVRAFKEIGATVFSTHYPNGGHLRHERGDVPPREGYVDATPL